MSKRSSALKRRRKQNKRRKNRRRLVIYHLLNCPPRSAMWDKWFIEHDRRGTHWRCQNCQLRFTRISGEEGITVEGVGRVPDHGDAISALAVIAQMKD